MTQRSVLTTQSKLTV